MSEWQPIETAPWQKVILVKNDQMEKPVRATRGYVTESGVHPDREFFTSVYTPDEMFPMPSGRLVCPTVWKPEPLPHGPTFKAGSSELIGEN